MNGLRFSAICAGFLCLSQLSYSVIAQEAPTVQTEGALAPVPPSTAADGEEIGPKSVTPAAVERLRQQAKDADQLGDKTRAEVLDLCNRAIAKLADAETLAVSTAALQKQLVDAGGDLEALNKNIPEPIPAIAPAAGLSADEVRNQLSAADQRASAAKVKVQKVSAEIDRRAARRQAIPGLITKCREQLAKAEESLKQPAGEESSLLVDARRLFQSARLIHAKNELQMLEQETRTYETTSRLWLAKRDMAEKQMQAAMVAFEKAQAIAAEVQRREAALQAKEARRVAVEAHPAVRESAKRNVEFAGRNEEILQKTRRTQSLLIEARELGLIMKSRLADVKRRIEASSNSPTIGVMLRSQQDQMPDLRPYRKRMHSRSVEISELGLDIYEWESLRHQSLHVEEVIKAATNQIAEEQDESVRMEIEAELRRVFEARASILAELLNNANDRLSRLKELDVAEASLLNATEELDSFIAERVLWVRSAPMMSVEDLLSAQALLSDVNSRSRQAKLTGFSLLGDARGRPLLWGVAVLLIVFLVVTRRRIRAILRTSGEAAIKPTAVLFRPTIEATLATIVLASPLPIACCFLGWRLLQSEDGHDYAAGRALVLFAAAYAMLNLVRQASRAGGLGTNHFGWDSKSLAAIRRAAKTLQYFALPLLAVAIGVEIAGDEAVINSLGRLSLVSALLITGVTCFYLFRPRSALGTALASSSAGSWIARGAQALAPVTTLIILGFMVASVAGYHYTTMKLTGRMFVFCIIVLACLALKSLLKRWLLVSYRRAAIQRAREKRLAMQQAQENAGSENTPIDTEPQINLSDINLQARKLVGAVVGIALLTATWGIWSDLLPALGVFSRVELWESGLAPANPELGPPQVTLTDLFFAVGICASTWFAVRNLPGLLEIAVLQRLPLDAGTRYAAGSVTRYVIMVVGVMLGMSQLGISWSSVQWLIAAMSVGLGFGLQEIFANFVSGIILLFERPARVGDTVTVGDITGAVSKIRIRATTIVDWDNKELVVPNKEFVTGNLVNWTLTNANLRLVVKVGVAYGSDTRLVTQLLYKVAENNPSVLSDPAPVVVFNEFGDSSLNFELRMFVSDVALYRRLRHDLHLEIDDLFRQNRVVIAFPQCDLHVKSMPQASSTEVAESRLSEGPDQQSAAA